MKVALLRLALDSAAAVNSMIVIKQLDFGDHTAEDVVGVAAFLDKGHVFLKTARNLGGNGVKGTAIEGARCCDFIDCPEHLAETFNLLANLGTKSKLLHDMMHSTDQWLVRKIKIAA